MYLKSIKIDGFKSFADKTIFELKPGITAVVGPNGSGKSNIVDAIRWVLGEQSLKSLRGGNIMSDVIFSGSEARKEANKASVTLTFNNEDHYLRSEFDEIDVKRCIYKSGESDYFINNTKVRLKDITDLFIESNASNESFNIISQGTITDIVNSKPIDRRVIFESASGVLKYKKRKEESIRKLDKTKDNLNSINLVIDELSESINPLKEQAVVAQKYLDFKEELKTYEIGLTVNDITNLNNNKKDLENRLNELQTKLDKMTNIINNPKIDKIKLDLLKIDDELNEYNKKVLTITEELANLNSEKRVLLERSKFEYSEDKIKKTLINLKEEELSITNDINLLNNNIDELNVEIKEKELISNNISDEVKNTINKRDTYNIELNKYLKVKYELENKIDILERNIENNESIPYSVKNILNNTRLKGIHNTIGNLISFNEEYNNALNIGLSSNSNFIIVDNELCAKDAINYLKDNNLGRATFLPINIISSRYISSNIIDRLESINGYIGIMSDLVEYDKKYQSIIENQLGNIIVAKDIDSMNLIAKIMEYKYKVISLDGDVIYSGGIISGGTNKKNNSLNIKKDLENKKNELHDVINKINELNNTIKELNSDIEIIVNRSNEYKNNLLILNNKKNIKLNNLNELKNKLKIVKSDIDNLSNNDKIDKKLENILESASKLELEKEKVLSNINDLKNKKGEYNSNLQDLEKEQSENNSNYKSISHEINDINVSITKIDMKLDNLLLLLSEDYNVTYEYAKDNFLVEIEDNIARDKVRRIKNEIKLLGEVNTGSISEYNRLNTRYEFLLNQKKDLEVSIENLLSIIADMDNIMIDKFKSTFSKVSEEFSKVFNIMFQGGRGELVLTDPTNYLETGIDMIIIPKGKKIHNNDALSGGEKSLTAICLLFAILNVAPVPYIVLDEVEAALDEVNIDLFGEYLNKKKNDSQYILITHKKRMMEYADVLYGITMQEAGVSKVVSVKLEDI